MKNYLKSIVAKTTHLKLILDDGKNYKYQTYIDSLNSIYGFGLLNKQEISVVPEDLICNEKDINTIVFKLREYFSTILDVRVDYKIDYQTFNGKMCGGFDIYGKSFIKIIKNN